ncbi:oxalate decarboxylase family bicupin protein [Paenibacillus amylolyticus]|uniref:Oxalate decarboxylase family bicupin protein n=1 Tax=Paenibacillus amylolyticus TaxID=1451 RepID=A0AAP5H266_PAEAM|nr:oxalate decarboxylase family bicupin protein [Paenibacillus amylolyticus]
MSFSDTHMQLNHGGWSREITVRDLPIATTLAGVNMSLTPGGVRELHWHQQSEWAYMILGTARITSVDQNGRNFIADVGPGDLWFFPKGIPHSIQGRIFFKIRFPVLSQVRKYSHPTEPFLCPSSIVC